MQVNEEKCQVFIHFDGWNQRFDEWIEMTSDRLRPLARHSERRELTRSVQKEVLYLFRKILLLLAVNIVYECIVLKLFFHTLLFICNIELVSDSYKQKFCIYFNAEQIAKLKFASEFSCKTN